VKKSKLPSLRPARLEVGMGRKKKRYEEEKPWCFYCDREFDDEKILLQHQKAKVRAHATEGEWAPTIIAPSCVLRGRKRTFP